MLKKIIAFIICILISNCLVLAEETTTLTGGISMVPKSFYGTWRVVSKRIETDSAQSFKKNGLDIWNLSRTNNVITLCNLFNGAKAEITVGRVDTKYVEFIKTGKYEQKTLTDKVEIFIDGDEFSGFDTLELNTYVDGKIVKTQRAKYSLKGEKISGQVD